MRLHRILMHISDAGEELDFILDRDALITSLERAAGMLVLVVVVDSK